MPRNRVAPSRPFQQDKPRLSAVAVCQRRRIPALRVTSPTAVDEPPPSVTQVSQHLLCIERDSSISLTDRLFSSLLTYWYFRNYTQALSLSKRDFQPPLRFPVRLRH